MQNLCIQKYKIQGMQLRIGKGDNLQKCIDMNRYMEELPSIHNKYYMTNILEIMDQLPAQNKKKQTEDIQLKTNIAISKNQSVISSDPLQTQIRNVTITYKHQCDGLENDTQVNGYQILKAILGKGSHSFVKLAKKDGKIYAVKTISFDRLKKKFYIKDHHIVKMVNCETNMLMKLKSQYVIGFEEAIYSPQKQRIFIVLEHCSKGSLLKIVNSSQNVAQAEWQKKAKGATEKQVLNQKVHESNVIHRDMKSQNVLVTQKDEIKLIDFNISSQIPADGTITITDKFVGTKTYAPPELVLPNNKPRQVDGRLVDVWALGVTFLQLYERKHPFNAHTIDELIKMLSKPVEFPKISDPELKDLLQKMLHLQNSSRIQVADILKHPWVIK